MSDIETLWNKHRFEITSYIGKYMFRQWGQDTINDLVSTVFLRAIVANNNGNGGNTNERAWLYSIARTVMIDHIRLLHYKTFVDWDSLFAEPSDSEPVEELVAQAITVKRVRASISQLVDTQRLVIEMRLDGYSFDEISEVVGRTDEGARALNHRAFSNLRLRLQEAV